MIRLEKIGEIETEMIGDIATTDTMNVLLRIGWGAETTTTMTINPAEDLHTGDGVRVIIERIIEEPDPEPEPVPEDEAATEGAPAGETTETKEANATEAAAPPAEAGQTETNEAAAPEAPAAEAPAEAEEKKEDAAGA